ncbi:MAG: nitroreductase [Massilibacillus sp.]|nr:nitroreductase [Massilibacillus sp.]
MDIIRGIEARRSVRKFQDKVIPKDIIERILELSTKAPSGKNRQPWKFVILQNNKKDELVNLMRKIASAYKKQNTNIGSYELTINSINEASVLILVFNPYSKIEEDYNYYRLITDTQSIGAAIQTIALVAPNFGLGTLWICDIFYCHNEIMTWLECEDELVAAVAIGYPNEYPHSRPRKLLHEVTEWIY